MLFKNTEEIKAYISIGAGTDFNIIKPHISNAETRYIKPLLSSNMYEELQEYYDALPLDNQNEAQEAMGELLSKVQNSTAHLAYWLGFFVLNSSISDSGFKRTESEKLKSLYKYQESALLKYFKTSGFDMMDEILEYLETNITQFSEFKVTSNWTELKGSFIPDTKTLESIPFPVNGSRLTFLRLRPHLQSVEDLVIKPLLGETIYDEIKAEMVKDSPAEKVIKILPYIRKPLAYLSSAKLMEESGGDLTEKGLYFESTVAGSMNDTSFQPANAERIKVLVNRNKLTGSDYLESLKSHLIRNASDWPDYSGQTGKEIYNRDNTDKKTFWA